MGCNASKADDGGKDLGSKSNKQNSPKQQQQQHQSKKPESATPTTRQSTEIPITPDENEDDDPDVKMLLLGSGECGKSTIWRQLKLLYCGGFQKEEREDMTQVVRLNLISDIKQLVEVVQSSGQSVADDLQSYVEDITELETEEDLTKDAAREIKAVWDDPALKTTYQQNNSIGLGDNASFFLDSSERIAEQDYLPTNEDLLKSRIRTTGISSIHFKIDNKVRTLLVDVGGQKCERAKWTKCFQGVQYVLFVVSLSDFDQFMFEDDTVPRTKDSLELFQNVANSPVFATKPIFLILNKKDVFEHKIKDHPNQFRETYPDFSGDTSNVDQCINHVKQCFLNKLLPDRNKDVAWVESITTCAMDDNSIRKLFQDISRKILSSQNQK